MHGTTDVLCIPVMAESSLNAAEMFKSMHISQKPKCEGNLRHIGFNNYWRQKKRFSWKVSGTSQGIM